MICSGGSLVQGEERLLRRLGKFLVMKIEDIKSGLGKTFDLFKENSWGRWMGDKKPFVVACIPAFNEERTIAKVVLQARMYMWMKLWFVMMVLAT